jgi:hypothetical protein
LKALFSKKQIFAQQRFMLPATRKSKSFNV